MTKVSILIVNYNSGDRLRRCLECLAAQTFTDFETIVVDNASADDSIALARQSGLDFRLIEAGDNLGFAAGNNLAAKEARGEWLAFLNPDAYARDDWLSEFVKGVARYRHVDAFGSLQLDASDPSIIDGAGDVMHAFGIAYRGAFGKPVQTAPGEGECFAPCAASAFYRRATFEGLGGFDERFFCYGEDVDLGFRLRLAGGRAVQLRGAIVEHEGSGVTGRASDFTIYHGHRNRIWLCYKNMPGALYWPLAPLRWASDLLLLAQAGFAGTGGAYWRALKDGYGGLGELSASRRDMSARRKASAGEIASALCWSPLKLLRRAPKIWPAPVETGEDREI